MAPYDQRKELSSEEAKGEVKRKLNINYEELEDSGSDGSEELARSDPNHLASIIEEEEEATEYQRSRSRSNSGSASPAESKDVIKISEGDINFTVSRGPHGSAAKLQ